MDCCTCASCTVSACKMPQPEHMPKNCPMREEGNLGVPLPEYFAPDSHAFFVQASEVSALGYGHWDRLQSIIQLCKRMGYKKVGLAFCGAVHEEARETDRALRAAGLEVVSVMCKTGHISKEQLGVSRFKPEGMFEGICNPIMQAKLMNEAQTQLNIIHGLCVGHDAIFTKYSDAMVTTVAVKGIALLPGVPVRPLKEGDEL